MIAAKAKIIIIPLMFCLFLTAAALLITLSGIIKPQKNSINENEHIMGNTQEMKIDMDKSDAVISSYDEYESIEYPLIAANQANNVRLYGIKPHGVILCKDGIEQFFDWFYLTPLGILPEITTADFDSDGIDEIIVNLYWGSGTGIGIEQLHIMKLSKDNLENDYFIDNQFMSDDYMLQLAEILQHSYDSATKILTIKIKDKTNKILCEQGFQSLNCIDIVQFKFEDGRIKAVFPLGIIQEGVVAEYGYGSLTAEVVYEDGKFTLKYPEFDESLDISLLHRRQLD